MIGKIRKEFYELRNDKESMIAISLVSASLVLSMLNDFMESRLVDIIAAMLLGASVYAETELFVKRAKYFKGKV